MVQNSTKTQLRQRGGRSTNMTATISQIKNSQEAANSAEKLQTSQPLTHTGRFLVTEVSENFS